MQQIDFVTGDTNFLCLVNSDNYASFVNSEWDLIEDIIPNVEKQQKLGHILMYQMTQEGIEDDWKINCYFDFEIEAPKDYLKKSYNYIRVTNNQLHIIDYTCLTMAAQFPDEAVPNKECQPYCIELVNGYYRVAAYLYKDVDAEEKIGHEEDLAFSFERLSEEKYDEVAGIVWGDF